MQLMEHSDTIFLKLLLSKKYFLIGFEVKKNFFNWGEKALKKIYGLKPTF